MSAGKGEWLRVSPGRLIYPDRVGWLRLHDGCLVEDIYDGMRLHEQFR